MNTPTNWPELDRLVDDRYTMLTTFRRSGAGVETVVWAASVKGRCLFTAPSTTGKVKRLATNERVTVGPGDRRGRSRPGPVLDAVARRVDDPSLLNDFRSVMHKKEPLMSRVIELRYRIKNDLRLVYELSRT